MVVQIRLYFHFIVLELLNFTISHQIIMTDREAEHLVELESRYTKEFKLKGIFSYHNLYFHNLVVFLQLEYFWVL